MAETEFDRRIAAGTIIVTMEGGLIQDVDGLKPGQKLEVWDFDTEGNDAELETNEAGDEYVLIEYSGGPAEIKSGGWVFYKGKPRQVYQFLPFGPTKEYPAIARDPRFDQVEMIGIKKRVPVSEVRRMTIEGSV